MWKRSAGMNLFYQWKYHRYGVRYENRSTRYYGIVYVVLKQSTFTTFFSALMADLRHIDCHYSAKNICNLTAKRSQVHATLSKSVHLKTFIK